MDMGNGAYVKLSEGPASGRDALVSAAVALILAAALAVALAALAGYLVAARIARPVVALTEASDKMAGGDLGARAPVAGGDEVGRLGESFNGMAARVETTVTSLRRFVADAAHEIGTPLTALQADLELAERKAISDDERRLVDRALVQTARLATLSDNLLQLSRLEAGEPAGGEPQSTDLAAVALELADGVASRAEQAGVELVIDVTGGPLPVPVERARLQTVLANLLDNAVKFTPSGGTVTLTVRPEGWRGAGHGRRHRRRHPGGGAAPDLRALSPGTQRLRLPRQRPGPGDRQGRGGAQRRQRVVRQLAGRHVLPRVAAAGLGGAGVPLAGVRRRLLRRARGWRVVAATLSRSGGRFPPRAVTTRSARASAPAPVA